MSFVERTGERFGRLVVIDGLMNEVSVGVSLLGWICLCDCGKYTWVRSQLLKRTNSCGCSHSEHMRKVGVLGREKLKQNRIKMGLSVEQSKTKLYSRWKEMKSRCTNPKYKQWYEGVKYSEEWKCFDNFKKDMGKSFNEHFEKHGSFETTLDRINPFGGYSKENCRWATRMQQTHNRKSTYKHSDILGMLITG